MIVARVRDFLKKCIYQESSITKLTLSFCIGNYIAFSPFLFLHTLMVFVFSWALKLNLPVTFAVSYAVNNPWTMIPVYSADYAFGHYICHTLMDINFDPYTPTWAKNLLGSFEHYVGYKAPCMWSFFIGGNLLGIATSVMLFPIMKYIFTKMSAQKQIPSS